MTEGNVWNEQARRNDTGRINESFDTHVMSEYLNKILTKTWLLER